eukprot:TRINITY_DN6206_c0_g4_i1.p1 TRINITY_DN6206_c0_g4~~TRINITY_DN6206_c0_g4_i1.p1  ORF type:complete len:1207 (+),score=395.90 TRINITY_DN6206_c0_g4_i1:96-3716(+)
MDDGSGSEMLPGGGGFDTRDGTPSPRGEVSPGRLVVPTLEIQRVVESSAGQISPRSPDEVGVSPRQTERRRAGNRSASFSMKSAAAAEERKQRVKIAKQARKEEEQTRREQEMREVFEKRVPVSFLIQSITDTYESKDLLRRVFVFVPFVITFTLWSVLGRSVVDGMAYYSANSVADLLTVGDMPAHWPEVRNSRRGRPPIRSAASGRFVGPKFHKTFFDVGGGGMGDFHDFAEGVIVPFLWDRHRDHGYLPGEPHFALGQVELLGSMKIRTIKANPHSCSRVDEYFLDYPELYYLKETGKPIQPGVTPNVTIDWTRDPYNFCYGRLAGGGRWDGGEDRRPYGENGQNYTFRSSCEYGFQDLSGEYVSMWPCGGYEVHLPFKSSYQEAIRFMYDLRNGAFLDDLSTRLVVVEFFTYDWSVNIFTGHKYFWEVTEGGAWIPQTQYRNFLYFTWSPGGIFLDFFFLAYIMYYVVLYWTDFVTWRKQTGRGFAAYFFHLWAFWEFINLNCFFACYVFRWIWYQASLNQDFKVPYVSSEYPEHLNYIMNLYVIQVYFNALNMIITYLKLLKFVRMHPKLNVLTRTLGEAAENIVVVLLVFILVLFAYSIAGNTIFGSGMTGFKDITTSFSTCMRILLGDFDYPRMREENRVMAYLWFASFNILALFLLLNFLIAVISSAFSTVQAEMEQQPIAKQVDDAARTLSRLTDRGRLYALWYRLRMWTTKPRALIVRDRLIDWKDQQRRMGAYKRVEFAESLVKEANRYTTDQWEDLAFAQDLCLTRGTGDESIVEDISGNFRAPRTLSYICPLEQLFLETPKDAKSVQEMHRPLPEEWVEGMELEILADTDDQSGALPRIGTVVDVTWRLKGIPREFFSPASVDKWLSFREDGVFVTGEYVQRETSMYYRAGLRHGQRIHAVWVDGDSEGGRIAVRGRVQVEGCYYKGDGARVYGVEVDPKPDRPHIKVLYRRTWRTAVAIDSGLLQSQQCEGKSDPDACETLDLADQLTRCRILGEYDEALYNDPSKRAFQLVEASILLDNVWATACAQWKVHKQGRDSEESEGISRMQCEVLQTAFEQLFVESQQRVDRDINRPLYGWMSTDFDANGNLHDTKRVKGGFSDEKLNRICQLYGHSAPGLRGAEERVADVEVLLICLHLFSGSVFRKLGFVYEQRRRWAQDRGFRITECALPPAQVLRENDISQWSQFVSDAVW